jgi:hypothetical protein
MCSICIVPLWRRRSPRTQASGASQFGGRGGAPPGAANVSPALRGSAHQPRLVLASSDIKADPVLLRGCEYVAPMTAVTVRAVFWDAALGNS